MELTDQEKETLTLALDTLLALCHDEAMSKKDIPGEEQTVGEDLNHIGAIHSLYKKFGFGK